VLDRFRGNVLEPPVVERRPPAPEARPHVRRGPVGALRRPPVSVWLVVLLALAIVAVAALALAVGQSVIAVRDHGVEAAAAVDAIALAILGEDLVLAVAAEDAILAAAGIDRIVAAAAVDAVVAAVAG
jgi:hypothetical protein